MARRVLFTVSVLTNRLVVTAVDYVLTFYDVQHLKAQLRQLRNVAHVERFDDNSIVVYVLGRPAKMVDTLKHDLVLYASTAVNVLTARLDDRSLKGHRLAIIPHRLLPASDIRGIALSLRYRLNQIKRTKARMNGMHARYFTIDVITEWHGLHWRDELSVATRWPLDVHDLQGMKRRDNTTSVDSLMAHLRRAFP